MNNLVSDFVHLNAAKAEKRAAFIKMLRDPDLEDLVGEFVEFSKVQSITAKASSGNGNGNSGIMQGRIIPSIRAICGEIPRTFRNPDVIEILKQHHYDFKGKDPREIVRDAVHFLCNGKNPLFRVSKKGGPGQHNEYEKVA